MKKLRVVLLILCMSLVVLSSVGPASAIDPASTIDPQNDGRGGGSAQVRCTMGFWEAILCGLGGPCRCP